MPPVTNPSRKTIEDFLALGEGVRAELVDGEILVNAAPSYEHQHAVVILCHRLQAWAEPRGAGAVLVAPLDVYLPNGDVVEPDVMFVSAARRGILQGSIRGVPDLVVEVLSPSSRVHDRVVKHGVYGANGVPELWIVDPEGRSVEVFRLERDRFERPLRLGVADRITSAVLPGFELPVKDLFLG